MFGVKFQRQDSFLWLSLTAVETVGLNRFGSAFFHSGKTDIWWQAMSLSVPITDQLNSKGCCHHF